MIRAAASLFAGRAYDGVSIDDLVAHLGVHRNSLYKVFGSKRGLYLAALGWYLEHQVGPLLSTVSATPDPARALRDLLAADKADLDLLLLAAVERAPVDAEVAEKITRTMRDFDATTTLALNGAASAGNTPADLAYALTAAILGLRLRARADAGAAMTGAALFDRLHQPQP